VDLTDLIAEEPEVRVEAAVEEVRLVRIPAGDDVWMIAAVIEDLPMRGTRELRRRGLPAGS
jgi:hypothetical protein